MTQNEFVLEYLELAEKVAKQLYKRDMHFTSYDDLYSECVQALYTMFRELKPHLLSNSNYVFISLRRKARKYLLMTNNNGLKYNDHAYKLANIIKKHKLQNASLRKIQQVLRKETRSKVHKSTISGVLRLFSGNVPLAPNSQEQPVTYLDTSNIYVSEFFNMLSDKQKLIFKHRLLGLSQTEIAKKIGKTQQAVGQTVKLIQKKWREYNEHI